MKLQCVIVLSSFAILAAGCSTTVSEEGQTFSQSGVLSETGRALEIVGIGSSSIYGDSIGLAFDDAIKTLALYCGINVELEQTLVAKADTGSSVSKLKTLLRARGVVPLSATRSKVFSTLFDRGTSTYSTSLKLIVPKDLFLQACKETVARSKQLQDLLHSEQVIARQVLIHRRELEDAKLEQEQRQIEAVNYRPEVSRIAFEPYPDSPIPELIFEQEVCQLALNEASIELSRAKNGQQIEFATDGKRSESNIRSSGHIRFRVSGKSVEHLDQGVLCRVTLLQY